MTKRESRKQRSNLPAMQRSQNTSLFFSECRLLLIKLKYYIHFILF
ncbi:hypothetical protein [Porphyromonas pogonae]|nr:hypothetical protein [Porphyromonas pogonae]